MLLKANFKKTGVCPFCKETISKSDKNISPFPIFNCGFSGKITDAANLLYDVKTPCAFYVDTMDFRLLSNFRPESHCICDHFTIKYDGCQCECSETKSQV